MTVNTISSVAEFETNGVTTNYPFYFKFLANEDLVVTYVDPLGVSSTLTLGTHYSANGAGNDQGGSIVTTSALAGPGQLVVSREMDAFQQTSLRNQGKFLAETHEDVFDKLTMLIQQGFSTFKRALTRPFGRDYFYAEDRRIANVKDPVEDQDAATKKSVEAYVSEVLETGQGPISNAANVVFVDGDGLITTVQKGVIKQFNSVANMCLRAGDRDGEQATLVGYHAAWNGYGGGPVFWDATSVETADWFSVFPVAGVAVGRWKRLDLERCNVYHAGAIQGEESSDAIQAVLNWVRARGYGTLHLGNSGFFPINKPLRGCERLTITGKGEIRAQAPFGTVTFDVFGGGTAEVSTLLYYVDTAPTSPFGTVGTIGNTSGSRRTNIQIDKTVTLDCDDIAAYGIFLDNYQYFDLAPRITDPAKWGIRFYLYGWTGSVPAKITGAAEGGVWLGGGANGIDLDGLMVWGGSKITSLAGVLVDGDNNGISFAGATIEKCYDGILLRNGFGPIDISGVDFEQIERHTVNADGSAVAGRINGPVNVTGCFLETNSLTEALVKGVNVDLNINGNRMRKAAKIYDHSGNGMVDEHNNVIESTVLSTGTGVIHRVRRAGRSFVDDFISLANSTMAFVREIVNYGYPYANLPSSGLSFSQQVTSGTNRSMAGKSTWWVAAFNLDVETSRMGLNLDNSTGSAVVTPIADNVQALGSAALRNGPIFSGTGTINTSDAREKTDVRCLTASEIAAAKVLGQQIGAYKWLASVAEKGDGARDHIGMTVQRAIEIMEGHGLDPFGYGFICYDQWDARPEQLDDEGRVTVPELEAGDRYSFRYDQLNLFIAAGFEARLSALEGK